MIASVILIEGQAYLIVIHDGDPDQARRFQRFPVNDAALLRLVAEGGAALASLRQVFINPRPK